MSSPRRRHWWCFQSEKREEAVVAWNLITNSAFFDMMMLRFEQDIKVGFREYMRSDGSRSYFFCLDTVRDLFVDAGFTEVHFLSYVQLRVCGLPLPNKCQKTKYSRNLMAKVKGLKKKMTTSLLPLDFMLAWGLVLLLDFGQFLGL
ncbi:hypothetical protein ACSBR2_007111 [Camellia fascicularis]